MFRVTKDTSLTESGNLQSLYFLHKKFLGFWVKWSTKKTSFSRLHHIKNNVVLGDESDILWHMKTGKYQFSPGENPQFFISRNWGMQEVTYYKSTEDFIVKNAEDLI